MVYASHTQAYAWSFNYRVKELETITNFSDGKDSTLLVITDCKSRKYKQEVKVIMNTTNKG